MMFKYYKLVHRIPVETTIEEVHGAWSQEKRIVAQDRLADCSVSTVFLMFNHRYIDDGPPLLFETLVFGGDYDGEMERYSTWEQAEVGHKKMVDRIMGK